MQYREDYPSGRVRVTYSGGVRGDGCWLLDGKETWYYQSGRKQWELEYRAGRKVGTETYWAKDGQIKWQWRHVEDGESIWWLFGRDGKFKAESRWRDKEYLGHTCAE